jgi:nucleoid-associated protein YgaU
MTRENKLALVVGFALILFVGILVSDHFSTARQQESADLVPVRDPLVESRRQNPDLLRVGGQPTRDPVKTVRMDIPPPETTRVSNTPAPPPAQPVEQHHTVRNGESLSAICSQHYRDASLASALAKYNKIENEDHVLAGDQVLVPSIEKLTGGATAPSRPTASPPPATVTEATTYTVAPGDMLSEIAEEVMGSARRWRDLYDHNRDVIKDPDHIRAGTVLRIPG